jgi:type IV pilus assembly protein PilV
MRARHASPHARGFSLVEVMVAVIVICVGMLGIAKMQAMSLSNTTTSRLRALAAIESASLASVMHSNRQYWANTVLPFNVVLNTGVVTSSDGVLAAQTTADLATNNACLNVTCTAANLAAFDMARWISSMTALLPNPTATVSCLAQAGVAAPPSCTITISWSEKAVGMYANENGAIANAAFQFPQYTLYVEP